MIIKPLKVKYGEVRTIYTEVRTIYTLIKTKHFFLRSTTKFGGVEEECDSVGSCSDKPGMVLRPSSQAKNVALLAIRQILERASSSCMDWITFFLTTSSTLATAAQP